jgi:heavy metal sensor kinase
MKNLSIRWRITLWNTAAFAMVLVAFGGLVYGLLRQSHYDQMDGALESRLRELEKELESAEAPGLLLERWAHRFDKHGDVLGAVFDAHGHAIAQAEPLNEIDATALLGDGDSGFEVDTIALSGVGRVRRLRSPLAIAGTPHAVVLLAELEHLDEEMTLVANSLLATIPLALLAAAALAYGLARKSLAPVEELRRRTDEITAERLDQRLPIANPTDELGLLAQTLNAMIARLARSFAEVRRFTADASHELRTPVAVIRSEAELGIESQKLDEARGRFTSIVEECVRLAWMTEQLLTLCRDDAGVTQRELAPVGLKPLVTDAVEVFRPLAGGKRQSLSAILGAEATVRGDPQRLRQVVYNLLDNAVKYTPEGGAIHVSLECRESHAALSVRDTGVGISVEHQPHVFERFYRVDPGRSRREGGTGLGLSIVQSIVAAHGGRVELESEAGRGSVFRVFLPLAQGDSIQK